MEIGVAVASKVGEYLVKPTINQVRYLFCFNSIVEDLEGEETNLKNAEDNVKKDVEIAQRNTEEIKKDVSKWLKEASVVLADVQSLKGEIDLNKNGWCPDWCCRYWLSRKAAKKTSMMLKLREKGKFNSVGHPTTLQPASGFPIPKDFGLFQSSQSALKQIIEALKNDKINLVGLYGMGGAGKTTLAKAAGDKVKQWKMFDEVVPVVVSQTPNFRHMQGVIADLLGVTLNQETEEGRGMRLYKRLTETKEKILIILDDVWEMFDLKSKIGFPLGEDINKDCKILLTTRKKHLCDVACQSQVSLGLLSDKEALDLLKQYAGRINDDSFTWNDLAIKVAKECKGLPLAIATIGSALKGKGIDEWKQVFKNLRNSKLIDMHNVVDVEKDVYAILKFSYDYLKGEQTRSCFLLCSLFPEDSEIPLEKLVRYGMGLGLFPDTESIEDRRTALRGMVNNLKASCLILDANDEHVKMHDMVRDVALWIASEGKNKFMVRAGMGLAEWPSEEGLGQYRAVSLMGNDIEVLPKGLFCPTLEILLVEGANRETQVSEQFFEEMKGLKVLNLSYWDLSLKSLQLLTNLKTLELINCNLRDFSYLAKLNRLEILSFQGSNLIELPREVGELSKLRLLDLDRCDELERIPSNVIRRCSQLEELHITKGSFTKWEVKETSAEKSDASLFELNSLPCLVELHLRIDTTYLPNDFAFRSLERYVIWLNTDYDKSYSRALAISKIDATSLVAFRALYQNVEHFYLNETTGCQNILPSIDQGGLNELKSLELSCCSDLKFVIDTSQQHLPTNALSNLVNLSLDNLNLLKDICYGGRIQKGLLEKMEAINVSGCPKLCTLFPTILLPRLLELKEVEISSCDQLEEVFQFQNEGLCDSGKESDPVLLRSLTKLKLKSLPQLSHIWKVPSHHVDLKTLTYLHIDSCQRLEHVFPISIAEGLVGLEELIVIDAPLLKQVFYMDHESEEIEEIEAERDEKGIVLPKLRKLTLGRLVSLTSFLPKHNYRSTCISLEELNIFGCSSLTASFISEIKAQDLKEKLRVLEIEDCHHELCDGLMLTCLRHGFKNLEKLRITGCGVKVVFQLDGLITAIDGQHELLLPNLKELSIEDCGELEQIIVEEDYMQPLSFPNLSTINVKRCKKLKHLFPITVVQSLQKLQYITLEDNSQLEKIFGDRDGADVVDNKEIMLPQLEKLSLKALPSLTNFCPVSYHFISTLRVIDIEDCHHELCDGLMLTCLRNGFKNLEKLRIKLCGVKVAFQLEGLITAIDGQHELLFPNLKVLSIEDCGELEQIIVEKDYMQPLSFPNLSRINVKRCNKLKHLLPISKVQSLEKLEYITLEDNSELEEIFGHKDGADAMDDEEKIVLPQLTKLSLKALPSFSNFSPSDSRCILNIRFLRLEGLKQQLCDGILGCLSQYEFKNLEKIGLVDCGVKVALDLEGVNEQQRHQLSLPSLKALRLITLEKLEHLCKGPTHLLSLQNLTHLNFNKCSQVRYIFTPGLAQNMSKLETLYVRDCGELEKIMVEDDEEDDDIQPHLLFPNLRLIDVRRCKKLKRVFPITIARGLQQLEDIMVKDSSQLEEVFGHKDGAQVMDNKAITLPQLKELYLEELPRLTNFCHVGYNFIFPSLKNGRLRVRECGKIATRFSWDEKESTVHAEAKPLNSKERSNDDEERTMDIYCRGPNQLRAKLPPYMEQIRTEGITPSTSRRET